MFVDLYEYGKKKGLEETWSRFKKPAFFVNIDRNGCLESIFPNDNKSPKILEVPYNDGTVNYTANLVYETAGRIFLKEKNKGHYRQYIEESKIETLLPILKFIDSKSNQKAVLEQVKPVETIAFMIDGKMAIDKRVLKYWRKKKELDIAESDKNLSEGRCSITGQMAKILKIIPKGINMGTGVGMVSFDKPAFNHYGQEGGDNCKLSRDAVETIHAAINDLLAYSRKHHLSFGDDEFIFWSDEEVEEFIEAINNGATRDEASKIFTALKKKSTVTMSDIDADVSMFRGSIIACPKRLLVRRYFQESIDEFRGQVANWFEDLEGIYGISQICYAIAPIEGKKPNTKKLPPNLFTQMLCSAIQDAPLPINLLNAAITRHRRDQTVGDRTPPARMAILGAFLKRSGITMLNDSPAYIFGQLLSVFNTAQVNAIFTHNSKHGQTLAQRLWNSFSENPYKHINKLAGDVDKIYIAKLRRDNRGLSYLLSNTITELMSKLPLDDPKIFNRLEQAAFAKGFYDQEKKFNTKPTTEEE